jgi:hypothetical protein
VKRAGPPTLPVATTLPAAAMLPLASTLPTTTFVFRSGADLIRPPLVYLVSGMAEYRRGNPNAAVQWLTRCRDGVARKEAEGNRFSLEMEPYESWSATASFYLAMAEQSLGHPDRAATALAAGRETLASKIEPADSALPNVGTVDWMIAHVSARQAEAIVGPKHAASPSSQP